MMIKKFKNEDFPKEGFHGTITLGNFRFFFFFLHALFQCKHFYHISVVSDLFCRMSFGLVA